MSLPSTGVSLGNAISDCPSAEADEHHLPPDCDRLTRRNFLSQLAISAGVLAVGSNCGLQAFGAGFSKTNDSEKSPDLYNIQRLSEPALLRTYVLALNDGCRYADKDWQVSSFDPAAGFWGDGVSAGNGGIRTAASMAFACATLIKYEDGLAAADREEFFRKTVAVLRYAVATHVTGTQRCTDGKPWGATERFGTESWQSGMWTGTLLMAAWLIWHSLDPALQQGIQRVASHESDILSQRQPLNGLWLDTKAEENGWEVPCLALSELMFPTDPHARTWHEAAVKYMMNTLCTEADTHDTASVDGLLQING